MRIIAHSICMYLLAIPVTLTMAEAEAQPKTQIPCKGYIFDKAKTRIKTNNNFEFKRCVDLPVLNSSLYWNYFPSNATVDIAYRHSNISTSSNWVAWAHNPDSTGMIGSQCLVAHRKPNGSMIAYTAPITNYSTELEQGPLSFNVSGLFAMSFEKEMIIFATITLPKNTTVLNQVWQDGPLTKQGTPFIHSTTGPNVEAAASLDLHSDPGVSPLISLGPNLGPSEKIVHGILSGVSWGIMMPIGASIARHLRRFPGTGKAWFYLHVGCQFVAYIIGIVGWGLGVKLGYDSPRVCYSHHRNIGFALFAFGSLQMCAFLVRPSKEHKYRHYWNRYHYLVGLTVMALSFTNVFLGLKILNHNKSWFSIYYGLLIGYLVVNIGLDMFTSDHHIKKSEFKEDDPHQAQSGSCNFQRP